MSHIKPIKVNDPPTILARKEKLRFSYIEDVAETLEAKKEVTVKPEKVLEVVSKVLEVITALVAVAIPLTMGYQLPLWVPLGIGIPLSLALGYANYKVKAKIEDYRSDNHFLPSLAEFLKHHTVRSLLPKSAGDLPSQDERLKSDKIMEKKGVGSSRHVADLASRLDLEVTPLLQQAAAVDCAHKEHLTEKWSAVREGQAKRIAKLEEKEGFKGYLEESQKLESLAFQSEKPVVDYPLRKLESYLHSLKGLHLSFKKRIEALNKLKNQGFELYKKDPEGWDTFCKAAEEINAKMEEYLKPLTSKDPALEAYALGQNQEAQALLQRAIVQTKAVERVLKLWIANHPKKKYDHFKEVLEKVEKEDYLSLEKLKIFHDWILKHPDEANAPLSEVQEQMPEELHEWLNRCSYHETPQFLFDWAKELHKQYKVTHEAFTKLTQEADALDQFEKGPFLALQNKVNRYGNLSFWKKLKIAFQGVPPRPFEKGELPQSEGAKRHKIEELRLNRLLQEKDRHIVQIHRVSRIGLKIIETLLPIISIILFYYVTAELWYFWALAGVTGFTAAANFFLNFYLQDQERQKQILKLQLHLKDHPDIGDVPGTHQRVAALKEVQKKYGLEGVRPTWARFLAEDGDTPIELSRKEAKKMAQEASNRAAAFLEDAKIDLYDRFEKASGAKQKELGETLKSIEATLDGKTLTPEQAAEEEKLNEKRAQIWAEREERENREKRLHNLSLMMFQQLILWTKLKAKPELVKKAEEAKLTLDRIKIDRDAAIEEYRKKWKSSTYELLTREQNMIDQMLNEVVEKKIALERKLKDFEEQEAQFNTLDNIFSQDFVSQPVIPEQIDWILESLKYKSLAMDPNLNIALLMVETRRILSESSWLPQSAQMGALENKMAELLSLPEGMRVAIAQSLRQLQRLQSNPLYQSPERVKASIIFCQNELSFLKEVQTYLVDKAHGVKREIKAEVPAAKPPAATITDQLLTLKWPDQLTEMRRLFEQLTDYERSAIWYQLPEQFREELDGGGLITFCSYIANPKLWKEDLEAETKERLMKSSIYASWYQDIALLHQPQDQEKWFTAHGKELITAFLLVKRERQRYVYRALPPIFQGQLKQAFQEVTGEALLKECKQVEENKVGEAWKAHSARWIESFKKLKPLHQQEFFKALPSAMKKEWAKGFYNEFTGRALLNYSSRVVDYYSSNFDSWWDQHQGAWISHFQKIGPYYQQRMLYRLPTQFQEKLDQFLKGA